MLSLSSQTPVQVATMQGNGKVVDGGIRLPLDTPPATLPES